MICCQEKKTVSSECTCDTLKVKSELLTVLNDSLQAATFYEKSKEINQQLWFADIESLDSTHFTRLWDSYHDNNFYASHKEFKSYYQQSGNAELAFQLGPAGGLWTYYTFVLKNKKCCYVITRTNFAHARFRYKAYSFVSGQKVDSLFDYIKELKKTEIKEDTNYLTASFIDNRNNEMFDVEIENADQGNDLKRSPPDSTVLKFLNFLDNKIRWTETYPLEPG